MPLWKRPAIVTLGSWVIALAAFAALSTEQRQVTRTVVESFFHAELAPLLFPDDPTAAAD